LSRPDGAGKYTCAVTDRPRRGSDLKSTKRDGLLVLKQVTKEYRGREVPVRALDSVSLTVPSGSFLAVMGPSGSGKSTLLHCASGLEPVDRGEVRLNGVDLAQLNERARADMRNAEMGFVFQSFYLLPLLSALENVELPLLMAGKTTAEARKRATDCLESVEMTHRLHHRPNELSGGEQQRVAIARAIVNNPAVIWADEPTGNLDSEHAATVMQLFVELHRAGATIVLVTHAPHIASYASGVVVMEDGRVAGQEDRAGRRGRSRSLGSDERRPRERRSAEHGPRPRPPRRVES
jgi:putative ABC transport system ATP-binding protein